MSGAVQWRHAWYLVVPAGLVLATSCKGGDKKLANGDLMVTGTVHMVQSQQGGTCWRLTSNNGGANYELQPAQVPPDLLTDNAKATVEVNPIGGGSFCKVGKVVTVVKVDSLAAPTAPATSGTAS